MSSVRDRNTNRTFDSHDSRTRSTSTGSRDSSSRSTSSQESGESLDRSRRSSNSQPSQNKHHKSGSFSRLFSTKEPSLDSFKYLAKQQQKELERKGQKIPFGVPQAKLPSSVKDDYKQAEQRAKERAKMHAAMKEKAEQHKPEDGQHGSSHARKSVSSISIREEDYARSSHRPMPPASPRSIGSKRFSNLEPLREASGAEDKTLATHPSLYPPSPPLSHDNTSERAHADSLLTGSARREALPWE